MNPGRELDALVAKRVMGWEWQNQNLDMNKGDVITTPGWYGRGQSPVRTTFTPSADISAAWEVVEKMRASGFHACVHMYDGNDHWGAQFHKEDLDIIGGPIQGEAPTAPHAICLAALKAVGELK